ncbi:hydrogenase accessory protein HypB [[Phormidium ambiguum] IAM M-71]|uniref:Hydrogenase accessory protein HypB n=1 Tax=[Phormidium ambiguum] IAM M-71 TaxID=454136 RepID=A0A1U7IAH8_9CYAN|nr:hydrogenase nickel incorporation protein HypB [Phormidium ambiguum]OKH33576.1 hydrogenase accessory protein HypB [Phormidium ambiguum IAM M-71]
MCTDCGCAVVNPEQVHIHAHDRTHPHEHSHDRHHHHEHEEAGEQRTIEIHQGILSKNDRFAERNRGYFLAKNLLVLNVLSSPGSGKTALLQRTISDIGKRIPTAVVVGDLETDNDAQRLRETGAQVIQITTGSICHLEADMVAKAIAKINLESIKLLIIENVGNLVCPAAYDLGESLRVVLLSVTEGEDKPLKYPTMFKTADIVIVNKIDIAEVVGFNRELAIANIKRVAPQATILEVSARTGWQMETFYSCLETHITNQFSPNVFSH